MAVSNDKPRDCSKTFKLDEVLPSLRHTCLLDHTFWTTCSASAQVAGLLRDYKDLSQMVCNAAKFVFSEKDEKGKKQDVNTCQDDLSKSGLLRAGPWLSEVTRKAMSSVLDLFQSANRSRQLGTDKLRVVKMPDLTDADAYCKVGLRAVGQLAQLTRELEADIKKMHDVRSAMTQLKSTKFCPKEGPPAVSVIGAWS